MNPTPSESLSHLVSHSAGLPVPQLELVFFVVVGKVLSQRREVPSASLSAWLCAMKATRGLLIPHSGPFLEIHASQKRTQEPSPLLGGR